MDETFGKNPGVISHFFPSLILSSRAWERGLVNKEMSGCQLSMEYSPELCFCQSPNYIFAEELFPIIFLSFAGWSYPLSAPGLPVCKHRPRLLVPKYNNLLLKLSP